MDSTSKCNQPPAPLYFAALPDGTPRAGYVGRKSQPPPHARLRCLRCTLATLTSPVTRGAACADPAVILLENQCVSRKHAELTAQVSDGQLQLLIMDLASKFGTFINGQVRGLCAICVCVCACVACVCLCVSCDMCLHTPAYLPAALLACLTLFLSLSRALIPLPLFLTRDRQTKTHEDTHS